ASTPMIPNQQLVPAPVDSADDSQLRRRYLQAVGSLMYAMLGTRPNLAHAVGVLGRFSSCPSQEHWAAVVRVCQYIKGTLDLGLPSTVSARTPTRTGAHVPQCRGRRWGSPSSSQVAPSRGRLVCSLASPPHPLKPLSHAGKENANALARNPQFHDWTRHLRLMEHFVREMVMQGMIDV
ncbi:hypothetical protein JCM1840_004399, partial [Sporobolomyces johnsonii]